MPYLQYHMSQDKRANDVPPEYRCSLELEPKVSQIKKAPDGQQKARTSYSVNRMSQAKSMGRTYNSKHAEVQETLQNNIGLNSSQNFFRPDSRNLKVAMPVLVQTETVRKNSSAEMSI